MGASGKKGSIYKCGKSSVKKIESTSSSKELCGGLSPMLPRQYSARERQEIRKKELKILRGDTK